MVKNSDGHQPVIGRFILIVITVFILGVYVGAVHIAPQC